MSMTRHSGLLHRPNMADASVLIQVSGGRCTIVGAPGRWIGSWPVGEAKFERLSLREFEFSVSEQHWVFVSDDPAGFADAVGVVVDLRPTARFGLGERVRQAREEQRLGR